MSAEEPSLLFEREGPTVVLTMNRPARRNALSIDMIVRMADAWEAIDADDSIRAAILTGAPGSYCVGVDLASGWMAGNRDANPTGGGANVHLVDRAQMLKEGAADTCDRRPACRSASCATFTVLSARTLQKNVQ